MLLSARSSKGRDGARKLDGLSPTKTAAPSAQCGAPLPASQIPAAFILMNPIRSSVFALSLLCASAAAVMLSGCATTYIGTDKLMNPPPSEAFSAFQQFEVKPIQMGAPYAGQEANDKALVKIQENFDLRVNPVVTAWNAKAPESGTGRTLVIEPRIQDIKFVNATARVWGGAMAGSSAVVLKIKFTDKATGAVIAEPEFFQRAAAMGGAWTFGATDNNMLVRITEVASEYISGNYASAVGGRTGAEQEK